MAKDKKAALSDKRINFRHPGYNDELNQNVMLRLYGFDHANGGVHHQMALTVCGIVACNTWNGYFTETRGGNKVELKDTPILESRNYYYFPSAPDSDDKEPYAVFASFNDWTFPHYNLPPTFASVPSNSPPSAAGAASKLSTAVLVRDPTCRISDYGDGLQTSHLCPRNQTEWFEANNMAEYCLNQTLYNEYVTDDIANAIPLRHDIHDVFDDQKIAFVPRDGVWKIHFFGVTNTLGRKYHDSPTQSLKVDRAFILARLAWTVFPLARQFFEGGPDRRVKIRARGEHGAWEEKIVEKTQWEMKTEHPQQRKQSQSPNKRSAPTSTNSEGRRKRTCDWVSRSAEEREWVYDDRTSETISRPHEDNRSDSAFSWSLTSNSSPPDDGLSDENEYSDILVGEKTLSFYHNVKKLKNQWIVDARPQDREIHCRGNQCKKTKQEKEQEDNVAEDVRSDGNSESERLWLLCDECRAAS